MGRVMLRESLKKTDTEPEGGRDNLLRDFKVHAVALFDLSPPTYLTFVLLCIIRKKKNCSRNA